MSNVQTLRAQLAAKELEVAAKQLEAAALREQVAAALGAEREEVISELLEKILANNIVVSDIFPRGRPARASHRSGPKRSPHSQDGRAEVPEP